MNDETEGKGLWYILAILVLPQIVLWPITLVTFLIYKKVPLKYTWAPLGFCITATIVWGLDFYYMAGFAGIGLYALWVGIFVAKNS